MINLGMVPVAGGWSRVAIAQPPTRLWAGHRGDGILALRLV